MEGDDEAAVVALLRKTSAWMPPTLCGPVLLSSSVLVLVLVERLVDDDDVKEGCRRGVCVLGIGLALRLFLLHGGGASTKDDAPVREKRSRRRRGIKGGECMVLVMATSLAALPAPGLGCLVPSAPEVSPCRAEQV